MNVRKLVFAVSAVAVVWAGGNYSKVAVSVKNPARIGTADGTAPLPPLPRKGVEFAPTMVADGTAPLPPLPRKDA